AALVEQLGRKLEDAQPRLGNSPEDRDDVRLPGLPFGADAPREDVSNALVALLLPRLGIGELGEELSQLLANLVHRKLGVRVGKLASIDDEDASHGRHLLL